MGAETDICQDLWHLALCRPGQAAAATGCLDPADVLSPAEKKRLHDYVHKYSNLFQPACCWRDLVCHLGDSLATGWTSWSATSCRMPTLRKTGGLMFFPAHNRHLLLREMYLAMGYLTFDVSHWPYSSHGYRVFVEGLTWNDMRQALGNAMHVAQVGSFAGCLLLTTRSRQDSLSLQEMMDLCDSTV